MGGVRVWDRTEIFLTVWRFVKSNVHILCFQLKFFKSAWKREVCLVWVKGSLGCVI